MRKAQIAYEFLFVMFFLTLSFTVWLMFAASMQENIISDREYLEITDLSLQLQDQLYATIEMPEGFTRTISLPSTIVGKSYAIDCQTSDDGRVSAVGIRTDSYFEDLQAPPLECNTGFVHGDNYLVVRDGKVEVNP